VKTILLLLTVLLASCAHDGARTGGGQMAYLCIGVCGVMHDTKRGEMHSEIDFMKQGREPNGHGQKQQD
jgi:hypothetical protein